MKCHYHPAEEVTKKLVEKKPVAEKKPLTKRKIMYRPGNSFCERTTTINNH